MKERGVMSQQYKRIQLPLIGAIILCLLIGVYLLAWKRSAKSGPEPTIIKHPVDTPSDDVLTYWTEEKMRAAKAPNLPNVNTLERGKQHPGRPPHKPHHS